MFEIGAENTACSIVVMLVGGALALALGWYRCRKDGIGRNRAALATALLPLCAVFFSHFLYGLVDVENTLYNHSVSYLFAFWERGQMFYGGLLGALLALLLAGGRDRAGLVEAYAPSLAWMAVVARVGEGLLGQGYGEYWYDPSFFCRFPFMVYDPYYEAWAWALFVLEALVALGLFALLLKRKPTWPGDGALLFFGLFASAQIVLESLRRDEFLRWGFVRVEELFSAVAVLIVLICYTVKAPGKRRLAKALCLGLYAAMITLCVLLEFATEGRVPFLLFLDVDGCYLLMAVACALLCGCVLWMRRLCAGQPVQEGEEH